jgi:DNA/RNA-binding domain of Phe-tRNA-synthetase-like protein
MDAPFSLQHLQISASLEESIRLGVVALRALAIGEQNSDLTQAIKGTAEELRRSLENRSPTSIASVQRTRRLYHQVGLDPTKQRPSSEKLLRRLTRGDRVPRINDFVDAMHLVSVRLQFPLGLYDWDRLAPPILLRIGSPNESYRGVSGESVPLDGRIVLVDGEGPFGNPTQDSERTAIQRGTVRALVILFSPADTARHEIEEGIHEVADAAKRYCGGQVVCSGIVP